LVPEKDSGHANVWYPTKEHSSHAMSNQHIERTIYIYTNWCRSTNDWRTKRDNLTDRRIWNRNTY